MAVRFSADGQDYTRTVTLGAQAAWSISCWVKITTDRNAYSTAWNVASTTSNYGYLQTDTDGTTLGYWDNGADPTHMGARALTVGTWYWWAVSVNGGACSVYSRAASDATTTVSSRASGGMATITQTTLYIGESIFTGEWLNGAVAAFKWWSTNLSQAELENESYQTMPGRTTNLRCWYPFDKTGTTDYSGNGQTLSGGTGAATEDGPPIPWSINPPNIFTIAPVTTPFTGWGVPM